MIDFEREIETRLRYFQLLNGKGNVKDCNHTLYEIIRLMLGMIQATTKVDDEPPFRQAEPDEMIQVNHSSHFTVTHESGADAPTNECIDSTPDLADLDKLKEHPSSMLPEHDNDPVVRDEANPAIYAPLGLTKFGNPKRDRSNHAK